MKRKTSSRRRCNRSMIPLAVGCATRFFFGAPGLRLRLGTGGFSLTAFLINLS